MTVATYVVPGVSCDHCKQAIEGEVAKVAGVDSVSVDVAARTAVVTGGADEHDVRAAIDDAGYDVESVTIN